MLDLDGDGVETTAVADGAFFDHDRNGFAEQTGWAGGDDGLLVRDINGDGIINDGKELFGNNTLLQNGQNAANGFAALSDLDGNADGKIDANDAAFAQLKVWRDFDGDGVSSTDELFTLSELGIASINTGSTSSTFIDPNGNEHRLTGTFTKTDGTTGNMADVWFQTDPTYTIATEWLDVPPEIASLPDLQGYGNVYDLQQAMVRDGSGQLKVLVESFIAATDPNTRNGPMEQILFKWTGVEGIDPASRGGNIDARKLAVLEKLYGEAFVGVGGSNPNVNAAPLLEQSYRGLYEMFYAQMMAQTHLKDLYGMITYTWDDVTQSTRGDLTAVVAALQTQLATDPAAGGQVAAEFFRTLQGFDAVGMMNPQAFSSSSLMQVDEFRWVIESAGKNLITGNPLANSLTGTAGADAISGQEGNDTLYGNAGDDVLYGGAGVDTLYGGEGNDTLLGGTENDSLYGDNGDDLLDGGTGNDLLDGGAGNDRYVFSLGSGADSISDVSGTDTVEFGTDPLHLMFSQSGSHLVTNIQGTTDQLTVQSWYSGSTYQAEVFTAADGKRLLNTQVAQLIQAMSTFCANNGLANWDQAITNRPQDVQAILAQYWST